MLAEFLRRLQRQPAHRVGGPSRAEICPPALLQVPAMPAAGWRAGLRVWLSTGWSPSSNGLPGSTPKLDQNGVDDPRLSRVRDEFLQALEDIRTQQVGMLHGRIRAARSMRELWYLRPEVFRLASLHFSQAEAQRRLDRLNRHFPTRSPRSGFVALDPAAADPRPTRRA